MGNDHSLATYVSDMLAVERHIRAPFDTQAKDEDFKKYARARELVSRLSSLSDQHVQSLKTCLDGLGGHEASPIKSAVLNFEGLVASAIDKVRKTKVSKALRDDYTALSLCCISYELLLATANGMNDTQVAALAERHLTEYSSIIMDISDCVPDVVLGELRDTGVSVDESAGAASARAVESAWRRAAQKRLGGSHGGANGSVGTDRMTEAGELSGL
ncbi:MAG: hypothetical protein M3Y18_05860 [Candidatus Eremiobacteraeota bacterium]|nr:hypothetical protein [Candidatus Eremiobacteraeota bacterium]